MPVKVLFRDLLERQKIIDAGVVDQNVQPAECSLRLCEDFFHIRRLCDIALHGDRFAALGFNVRNDAIGAVLARGIVDDDRRAFPPRALWRFPRQPLFCQTICS